MKQPDKEFDDLSDAIDQTLEKDIPEGKTAIIQSKPKKQKHTRISGMNKDRVAQLVQTMNMLGFTKTEAAKMITESLYPNGEDVFTPRQYMQWLGNYRASQLMYMDYYSREGVVLDMMDINESLKNTYQQALRQFRRECVKKPEDRPDKGYIIKLGYLIKDLAEERQRVIFSVPFVNSFKKVIDRSRGVVEDIKSNYPSLVEVSDKGDISVRVPKSKSGSAGDDKEDAHDGVSETTEGEEAGTASTDGDVQSDTDDRSVSQTNRTAGTATNERVF